MKTTDQTLSDQQLFLLAHRRHHHFVHFARIFMLLLFLTVWELFADFHITTASFSPVLPVSSPALSAWS